MTNPAALSALAKGDIDNFLVASTPGGIESQEKAGQALLVASTNMPKDLRPAREVWEQLGFKFGADADDIFISAQLPEGWKREASDHSMWSYIVDGQGRRRASVFYKAAFYDRSAHARLEERFQIDCVYPERNGPIPHDTMIPMVIKDGGTEIHRLGETKYVGDWEAADALRDKGKEWLDTNRPGWRDSVTSWNV